MDLVFYLPQFSQNKQSPQDFNTNMPQLSQCDRVGECVCCTLGQVSQDTVKLLRLMAF